MKRALFTLALGAAIGCGSNTEQEGFSGAGGGGVSATGGKSSGGGPSGGSGGYAAFGGESSDAAGDSAVPKLGPPYPIVLAHGFFGFEAFAGLDAIRYFFGVKDELAKNGETLVFTPAVDPFNDSKTRGAQLLAEIQKILEQTGYEKVNIIGHSQGGLDARVVAHDRPDLVASVTTIATPHYGTPLADVIIDAVSDPNAQQLIDWFVKQIGYALYDTTGEKTSLWKPLELFSKSGIDASCSSSSKPASRNCTFLRPAALASVRAPAICVGLKSAAKTSACGLAAAMRLAVKPCPQPRSQ